MRSSLWGVGASRCARRFGKAGGRVRHRRLVAVVSALGLLLPALVVAGASGPAGAATGAPLFRINAGGPTLTDPGGDFIGVGRSNPTAPGVTLTNDSSAADVTVTDTIDLSQVDPSLPMALFQSLARTTQTAGNQMNWAFTVPAGSYEVRLHFAEHQSSTINAIGGRVFDVAIEGNTVLDNYDMLANTNPPTTKSQAITETIPGVVVSDGTLNLDITAVTSVAIIRGIEILPETGGNSAPTISASPNPATVVAGQTTVVDLTTNDVNGDPVTTQITSGPAFASLVGGDLQLSPGAGDVAGSPYTVTVEASDGTDTSTVNVTVNVITGGAYLYRINAGGEDVGGYTGVTTAPGTVPGFTLSGDIGGTVDIRTDDQVPDEVDLSHVDPSLPEAIFQTVLYSPQNGAGYNWDFNVPNGTYEVDLHWMEHNFATITDVGQRLIDVSIEGNQVLDDLDELATGTALAGSTNVADGYNVAFTTPFEVTVTDGVLNVFIIPQLSVANLRAIDVRSAAAPNDPPTISASPNPVTVTAGQTGVVDLTTGDPNGDPVTTQITSGPAFASLVAGDLQLSPGAGDVAGSPYTVTVEASDGTDTASVDVTVNVAPVVEPPEGGTFGDFNGDGNADFGVFRPSNSRWFVTGVAGSTQWGKSSDVAVPGDYDGDGTTDIAVWRPSNGRWFVNGTAGSTAWGKSGDVAVPGDYNGDGSTDFAVWRPSNGRWYVNGIAGSTSWGKNGDVAVPGDYDGDGTTDFAVFRPSNGRWYVNGVAGSTSWGKNGDVAVPGDYNGDGTTDIAVWRPSNGRWFVNGVAGSTIWGKNGDVAVPADYNGDGSADFAVWRPSNGRWFVNGIEGSTIWGKSGDVPVTRPVGSA